MRNLAEPNKIITNKHKTVYKSTVMLSIYFTESHNGLLASGLELVSAQCFITKFLKACGFKVFLALKSSSN